MTRWCVNRLTDGFNGRPNKPSDTCYTFWIGASLVMLEPFPEVSEFIGKATEFVLSTEDDLIGGLAKASDVSADPLHTYLGIGGLALAKFPGLKEIDPALNIAKQSS